MSLCNTSPEIFRSPPAGESFMQQMFRNLKIGVRLWMLVLATVISIAVVAAIALSETRQDLLESRKLKTEHIVNVAHSVVAKYHERSTKGEISE